MAGWLARSAGVLLGVGGVVYGLVELAIALTVPAHEPFSTQVRSTVQAVGEPVQLAALLLVLVGVAGLMLGRSPQPWWEGAGYALALVGVALAVALLWSGSFLLPPLATSAPAVVDGLTQDPSTRVLVGLAASNLLFGIGLIALAAAQLARRATPRPAWALLILAVLLLIPIPAVGGALFAGACAWLGATIARRPLGDPAAA
jgi:hypothetical protein